ncbi:hypothetical protein PoB_005157200 [Plakobranchus ocellatus]|uniref:Uncharacterized protein n=1 Tax=Plakobranchus ocellatus TaxID=259542 RepID=A0AAV4C1A4_9GAST|nr:hypothetical protein PoB_005157200 [Plakobranchus ocellatus]
MDAEENSRNKNNNQRCRKQSLFMKCPRLPTGRSTNSIHKINRSGSIQIDQSQRNRKTKGQGVHIERPNRTMETHSFTTGMQCSDYKAEAITLEHAAPLVKNSSDTATSQIVLLTDAKSVPQALQNTKYNRNDL